jgi:hypothetical protein
MTKMTEPEPEYLYEVKLSDHHQDTGAVTHYYGSEALPLPASLRIMTYSDVDGFYLLYLDAQGDEMTDTYHETLEQAFAMAKREFTIDPADWKRIHQDE